MNEKLIAAAAVCALSWGAAACETTYEFDPIEVGVEDDTRTPRPKTDGQFIRSVYGDVLGRPPGTFDLEFQDELGNSASYPIDEEAYLLFVLDGAGDAESMRALLTAGLVESDESPLPQKAEVADPEVFIGDQFRSILGREPSTYELSSFVAAWERDEAVTPRVIVRAIIGSREYQSQ